MNSVDRFIRNLEYLVRDDLGLLSGLKQDIRADLKSFFRYIDELENPVDRPDVKDVLEAQDDQSFNATLNKYRDVIRDTDLGNLRREASAIRREGLLDELYRSLLREPKQEEDVA